MRLSCSRLPWSDLDSAFRSSDVTSPTPSTAGGCGFVKVCCGSISCTVDLKRTVGPTLLSAELLLLASSGAIRAPSAEIDKTHQVRKEPRLR